MSKTVVFETVLQMQFNVPDEEFTKICRALNKFYINKEIIPAGHKVPEALADATAKAAGGHLKKMKIIGYSDGSVDFQSVE